MRKTLSAALVATALATPAIAADAPPSCSLIRLASLDMEFDDSGGIEVPMTVSGKSISMLVDTGGIFTMISKATAQSLGLTLQPAFDTRIEFYGGAKIHAYVEVPDIDLGGLKAPKLPMQVIPDGVMAPGDLGGMIGPNLLSHYDVEFDFANAKMNLFSPQHCEGQVVYWTATPHARVPILLNDLNQIELHASVDGRDVKFYVDTGSSRSVMDLDLARKLFGIADGDPKLTPEKGANPGKGSMHYPFQTLTFEGIAVNNPDITLVPASVSNTFEQTNLLGMGILRQLHVYIDYKEHMLYLTPATAH